MCSWPSGCGRRGARLNSLAREVRSERRGLESRWPRGTQPRRPPSPALARAAPDEPARARRRGGRHAAPRVASSRAGARTRAARWSCTLTRALTSRCASATRSCSAAGYAPQYRETGLDDAAMAQVRGALDRAAGAPRAAPRGRDGPPLEHAAHQRGRRHALRLAARRRGRGRATERRAADVRPAARARRQLGRDRRGADPARPPRGGRRRPGPRRPSALLDEVLALDGHPGALAHAGLRPDAAAAAAGRASPRTAAS